MIDTSKMIADVKLSGRWHGVFFNNAGKPVFSAERIQQSVSVFNSRPIVMSSDVVSWKTLTWSADVPPGTTLYVYVRTSETEPLLESAQWRGPFLNGTGEDLTDYSGRIMQLKIALYSNYDDNGLLSAPVMHQILVSCYVKGLSQVFYTSRQSLGFIPTHVLLTYNGTIPKNTIVNFAISTENSTDLTKDYQIIPTNTVMDIQNISKNPFLKVAVSALGNTEIPFVIDEFALALGGDKFTKVQV